MLIRWLLILFALPLAAQITCNSTTAPVIAAGASFTCTNSGGSVTWSLGTGSVGSLSGTNPAASITYTAPTGIVPAANFDGCPSQPNDSIFNLRMDALPADANSATKITTLEGNDSSGFHAPLNFQPSWGTSLADSTTPTTTYVGYYTSATYTGIPVPLAQNTFRESGNNVGKWSYGQVGNNPAAPDHHKYIVNRSTCVYYDTYLDALNGATYPSQIGSVTANVQSVGIYSGLAYAVVNGGTDAAGLPLGPLTLTDRDLRGGVLGHALRFTDSGNNWAGLNPATSDVIDIWPATATTGGCIFSLGNCPAGQPAPTFDPTSGQSTNYVSMGQSLLLNSSFATAGYCNTDTGTPSAGCSVAAICASPLTSTQITMCSNFFTGIMRHPLILSDIGSDFAVTISNDVQTDPDAMAVLTRIQGFGITRSNWYVPDVIGSGVFYGVGSYQVTPNGSAGTSATYDGITYSGATQSSVTPATQAIIVGGSNKISVVVQAIAIGSSLPPYLGFIQAGHPGIPMGAYSWVNPSSVSQSIVWTVVGCSGSFTGSTYIPPATAASVVPGCALHGVAVADSAATIDIRFNLFPSGTRVAIDTGSGSSTVDGNGDTWQADTLPIGSGYNSSGGILGSWGGLYANEFNTQWYVPSADFTYSGFVSPTSNWKLHILMGQAFGSPGTWVTPSGVGRNFSPLAWNPVNIEVNSTVEAHNWNWPYLNGFLYNSAANADIVVPGNGDANGYVTFSVRPNIPDTACPSACSPWVVSSPYSGPNLAPTYGQNWNLLSGFELVQDSTSPFLSIDLNAGGQPSGCAIIPTGLACAAGTALQPLYAINHYISGFVPTSTTWSVLSNSSGITASIATNADGSGSLTLGSGTPLAGQPIVVQATNGSHSATATILTLGSKWLLNAK